ncbi:MAG: hypothetical protein IJD92_01810 [Bacilli bacterium]|nr:hypothetical protein [Bacilli bacterium]
MIKQNKILIITLSLVIGLLSLIGFSYAYYLISVKGNTTNKSIVVTSADLELIYDDGTNEIITMSKFRPDTIIATKTFTVENTGSKTNNYAVYLEDVINEYERQQDMNISLSCKTINTTNDEYVEETCNGINGNYPNNNAMLVSNDIDINRKHEYTLVIKYLEAGVDQSVDMAKKIEGKIQIYNLDDTVDLKGSVTGSFDGYCVETINKSNENTKISHIESNGDYLIPALEAGNYTIRVKDCTNDALKGSIDFSIKRGKENKVENGNEITVTANAQTIPFNITKIDTLLEIEVNNEIIESNSVDASYIALNAETYYGKTVNYTPTNSNLLDIEWQIFHSDGENIYLIAKNPIFANQAPSKNGVEVLSVESEYGYSRIIDISYASNEYKTVEDVRNAVKRKWIDERFLSDEYLGDFLPYEDGTSNITETVSKIVKPINMQPVAYMHDDIWTDYYKDSKNTLEYAMGGVPLTLFLDSFNKVNNTSISYGFQNREYHTLLRQWGYYLDQNGVLKQNIDTGLSHCVGGTPILNETTGLYYCENETLYLDHNSYYDKTGEGNTHPNGNDVDIYSYGYWLASPSGNAPTALMSITSNLSDQTSFKINYNTGVRWDEAGDSSVSILGKAILPSTSRGVRPIICLKSSALITPAANTEYDYIIN